MVASRSPLPASHFTRLWEAPGRSAAIASVLVALLVSACPSQPPAMQPRPIDENGARLARLSAVAPSRGGMAQARVGDWALDGKAVHAVVGGHGSMLGALLDLSASDPARDRLAEYRVALRVDGRELPLSVKAVTAARGPTLVISAESVDRRFEAVTRVSVAAGGGGLTLRTTVESTTSVLPSDVSVVDRVHWIGADPFAPGLSVAEAGTKMRTEWVAFGERQASYAIVAAAPFELVLGERRGPSELSANFRTAAAPGRAGRSVERTLLVAAGSMDVVAARAWQALGVATGQVDGRLEPAPRWASIEAYDERGSIVARAAAGGDGRFALTLPRGSHRLRLRTPGGSDETTVRVGASPATAAFVVPEPAALRFRVTGSDGVPLPARLNFSGIAPTSTPVLGPPHLAAGAGAAVHSKSGEGVVQLPPGRYRVLVSHGPEWSLWQSEVSVTAEEGTVIRPVLDRALVTDGWLACDFHLHADPSGDSNVPLSDRVTSLLAEGIGFAVATDHNHVTDYHPAVLEAGVDEALGTAIGVELTTLKWGHFNVFPYPFDAPLPPYSTEAPVEMFRALGDLAPGAVLQVNHPRMREIGYFNAGKLDAAAGTASEGFSFDFDTIEVINGFELGDRATVESNVKEWMTLLGSGRLYTAVGNSDSHDLSLQWAGYPRTWVRVGAASGVDRPAAVVEALRRGRAQVSNGPFILLEAGAAGPGDVAPAKDGKLDLRVRVWAAPWVDVSEVTLVVGGDRSQSVPITPTKGSAPAALRVDANVSLAATADTWVVVIVRGARPLASIPNIPVLPYAFTNPLFVDGDGDGTVTAWRRAR